MLNLLSLLITVLAASALCSMVEAAILSISSIRARVFFEQKRKGSRDLLFIKEHINMAIATIVLINNTVNIMGSIFVGREALRIFGSEWLAVSSAVITFLIIVFAEVIPKTIGESYKTVVSLSSAKILRFIMWLLRPIVHILIISTKLFRKRSPGPKVTEEEIKIMLKLGSAAGTIEIDEESLCSKVFKLNDLAAIHIMKPIDQIYALPADKKLIEVRDLILDSPYSRIAVYDKDAGNIVGVCQQRALLKEIAKDNYDVKVSDIMSRPIFVDENEKAKDLLNKFQAHQQHLFIVHDKSKKNIGIVSMEDVLEELFGEIYDERDKVA